MIKAVIFDIDNTLYDFDEAHRKAFDAVTEYAVTELGMTADGFAVLQRSVQKRLMEEMGDVAAIHSRIIRYQNLLEQEGRPLSPHALRIR